MTETAKSKVAKDRLDESGSFYEPRVYYSYFPFDGTRNTQTVWSDPRAYWNGEQFPVRITHVTMAMMPRGAFDDENYISNIPAGDPRALQFYGIRVMDHDTYYPSGLSTPLPLLHNTESTVAPSVANGTAVWTFEKPFILSSWDSIRAEGVFGVNLINIGVAQEDIYTSIAFDGYGLFSKRAYRLGDTQIVDSANSVPPFRWSPENLRNEGAEPIVITRMQVTCIGTNAPVQLYNISFLEYLRVRIRIDGNGTTGWWGIEPAIAPVLFGTQVPFIWSPAGLYGVDSRAGTISHKIPGDGWMFQPGEGVVIELAALYGTLPPYEAGTPPILSQ